MKAYSLFLIGKNSFQRFRKHFWCFCLFEIHYRVEWHAEVEFFVSIFYDAYEIDTKCDGTQNFGTVLKQMSVKIEKNEELFEKQEQNKSKGILKLSN